MSISKDSSFAHFAAVAGEKYKVALQHAQWAFSVDWCISSFLLLLHFEYDFYNKQINNSHENSSF